MFHIPTHKQGSTAPVVEFKAPAVAEVVCPVVEFKAPAVAEVVCPTAVPHIVGQRASTYRGKYPKRIAMVAGPSKATGLYLQANDGTSVRMDNATAYALCQALGKTKNGPELGDDITPYLPELHQVFDYLAAHDMAPTWTPDYVIANVPGHSSLTGPTRFPEIVRTMTNARRLVAACA